MITAKILWIAVFRKQRNYEIIISFDDKERIYQSKKPTTPEELKEALTIKDLGSRSFSRGAEAIRDYVYLKSPDSSRW